MTETIHTRLYTTIGIIATPTTATTPTTTITKIQLNGKCSNIIVIRINIRSTKMKSI